MKNSVKLLGIIALVAAIGFSFASCKEDGGIIYNPVGTWSATIDGSQFTSTVKADGTFSVNAGGQEMSGTWTRNGNVITFSVTDQNITGTMTLTSDTEGTMTFNEQTVSATKTS